MFAAQKESDSDDDDDEEPKENNCSDLSVPYAASAAWVPVTTNTTTTTTITAAATAATVTVTTTVTITTTIGLALSGRPLARNAAALPLAVDPLESYQIAAKERSKTLQELLDVYTPTVSRRSLLGQINGLSACGPAHHLGVRLSKTLIALRL
jgi:hypothetical protein